MISLRNSNMFFFCSFMLLWLCYACIFLPCFLFLVYRLQFVASFFSVFFFLTLFLRAFFRNYDFYGDVFGDLKGKWKYKRRLEYMALFHVAPRTMELLHQEKKVMGHAPNLKAPMFSHSDNWSTHVLERVMMSTGKLLHPLYGVKRDRVIA